MYPKKIEKQVDFLENNRDFELCFHNVDVYDDDTGTILYKWLDKYIPTRFPPDALYRANWYFRKDNRVRNAVRLLVWKGILYQGKRK